MATGAAFSVINGQLVQTNLDPAVSSKAVIGTCINCGQVAVQLAHHYGHHENVRFVCLSATQIPFTDPNQSSGVGKQTGSSGNKHR